VLAHEWGHAIQGQTTGVDAAESIVIETQADCATGAWIAYLDSGESDVLALEEGDLEIALAAMLSLRDPPGSDPTNPLAHGNGFDRVSAFQDGFVNGIERCSQWIDSPPTFTEYTFGTPEEEATGGNLALDELLPLIAEDLNAYWSEASTNFTEEIEEPVGYDADDEDDTPECENVELDEGDFDGQTFWCEDDNTVYFDENLFDVVHSDIGDFGVAVLVSNAYATAVQEQGDGDTDPLLIDCLSGTWTGSLPPLGSRDDATIQLSPGDLDEVIQSFINFAETGEEALSPFDRTAAFSAGFNGAVQGGGVESCAS
jgi:predicted metalloprotease